MTAKFLSLQTISLRPQNDTERLILEQLNAHVISGKKPSIKFEKNGDMIVDIKSEVKKA